MNKFKYFFILLIALTGFVSCNKDDDNDVVVEPLRDFATQFAADKATIESYLNTHYIVVTESEGNVEDMDVVIDSIETPATQVPIMSYKANVGTAIFPQLKSKTVDLHGITYELYYLVLREGTGESPMNTDGVLTSYSGSYLSDVEKKDKNLKYVSTTFFEQVRYPQSAMDLAGLISGWSEIFPEFKEGNVEGKNDGTISYTNFGAGVMFLPSGLGYYTGSGSIPSYRPLVFSFKLYQIQRLDHDSDGVLDFNEDINGDGYVRDFRNTILYPNAPVNPDDTDVDGIPDFIDIDDDGDGYTTKLEITKPTGKVGEVSEGGVKFYYGPSKYYPFEKFDVADDPETLYDEKNLNSEPKGIPRRPTGPLADPNKPESSTNVKAYLPEDYTDNPRLRIHLDKTYPIK
ncbi:FKBP-type peptidylprolyl isomerase [Flavobacterium sp.]|uniref:FKBP-type peptidyl-prolyl cis-trans isomerase n=1 Tax=Flavobacterium sp. TaxID=239 RepID=UPI003266E807